MKKIVIVILLIGASLNSFSQNWAGGIDGEPYNWGFSFQYISAEYKIRKIENWRSPLDASLTDPLKSLSSKPTPGFAIGFVGNKQVTRHLDLRVTPSLVFSDRKLVYEDVTGKIYSPANKSVTAVDLPLSLKLKSDRLNNFRAYMIGGLKYTYDLTSERKQDNLAVSDEYAKFINHRKSFFSYEAGAGLDFYFGFFKMSTELKVSHSFKDILKHEDTSFVYPIEKAKLRHFTFSLFFE